VNQNLSEQQNCIRRLYRSNAFQFVSIEKRRNLQTIKSGMIGKTLGIFVKVSYSFDESNKDSNIFVSKRWFIIQAARALTSNDLLDFAVIKRRLLAVISNCILTP
jgi:hypothetical protein